MLCRGGTAMLWYEIVFLVVYACLTVALITMKALNMGNRKRGVVKTITAVSFAVAGLLGCIKSGGGNFVIACIGLFFAAIGDVLLIFMDDRRWFVGGVLSFSMASLVLSVFSVVQYGFVWWSVIVFAVFAVANVLCQKFNVYSFGRNVVCLNIYTVLVAVCGSLGLTLIFQGTAQLPTFLFGLGCFMYYVSDIFLGLYLFKFRNRIVDAINSLLYFPGMVLIAFSMIV